MVLRTPVLDPHVLPPEAHVTQRRFDESLVVDFIGTHRRFLTRKERDHLDELAEAHLRIQPAELCQNIRQWARYLGIHGSFSPTVG
jgi:hypothetical protein